MSIISKKVREREEGSAEECKSSSHAKGFPHARGLYFLSLAGHDSRPFPGKFLHDCEGTVHEHSKSAVGDFYSYCL